MTPSAGRPQTILEKIWCQHVVRDLGNGWALLHVDRHLLHDISGPKALADLAARRIEVTHPELVFATLDHAVSSQPGRTADTFAPGGAMAAALRRSASTAGIRLFDLGEEGQGIVHVMAPELGLVLPGLTVICGDSHTCTNGGLGALAFGVGTSESSHALATGTLRQRKPATMRVEIDGGLGNGVSAKDLALHLLATLGSAAGVGHMIEYAGSAVRSLDVEGRLTLCNLAVEMGARSAIVAPDATTFSYLRGRPFAPQGADFDRAVDTWSTLATDCGADFDREARIDATAVTPSISWGTSPDQVIPIDRDIPDPRAIADPTARASAEAAITYMGLTPGAPIEGTAVDWVFIGSCANSRLSDIREAARIARGRHVAAGVTAWVVPGSVAVQRAAQAEGLDRVLTDAGFAWREPGCSMCVAANGEQVPPGARSVSTSNRNFVGRQGPGARTHLASPAMATAAAITGVISDVRRL